MVVCVCAGGGLSEVAELFDELLSKPGRARKGPRSLHRIPSHPHRIASHHAWTPNPPSTPPLATRGSCVMGETRAGPDPSPFVLVVGPASQSARPPVQMPHRPPFSSLRLSPSALSRWSSRLPGHTCSLAHPAPIRRAPSVLLSSR